jgi:hypothetical protein
MNNNNMQHRGVTTNIPLHVAVATIALASSCIYISSNTNSPGHDRNMYTIATK